MVEDEPVRGRRWVRLAALFLVALTARAAVGWWLREEPLGGDEIEYDALARGLIETGRYARQPGFSTMLYSPEPGALTSFRPPGWPFVLAGLFRVLGYEPLPARIVLAAWNAAGCIVLVLLLERLFADRRAALAAGFTWALWPAAVWYPGTRATTLSTESLAIPLLLVALLLLPCAREGRAGTALASGMLLGACALVRSNFSLLVPLAALWIFAFAPGPLRGRAPRALLLMIGAAVVVCPWMLRNQVRLGAFTIATQREPIFLGNNDWARGSYDAEFFNDRNSAQVRWLLARHPRLQEEDEVQKGRTYVAEAVRYAREHPLRQAWLVARRAMLFLSPLREREDADNAYDWAFATVASLCVMGIAWLVRTQPSGLTLLALPVAATFATCLIVLFLPRYRYPCEPMLIGLASQVAFMGVTRYGSLRILAGLVALVAVNVGIALFMG